MRAALLIGRDLSMQRTLEVKFFNQTVAQFFFKWSPDFYFFVLKWDFIGLKKMLSVALAPKIFLA